MLINKDLWLSKPRILCGVMTGTSLDGIDIALVKFEISDYGKHKFELIYFQTIELPEEIPYIVKKIIEKPITIAEVSFLHYVLSDLFVESIRATCKLRNFRIEDIDAIGIHGQTVWHDPYGREMYGFSVPSTLQLCSPSVLSKKLNIPVIADFRAADIALGGQGAPLVPIFDYEFLRNYVQDVIALNIGGMANITLLPSICKNEGIIAFDTGPGNVLIDSAMNLFYNKKYDSEGKIARSGKINESILNALKLNPFIRQTPPKSTGRELFNNNYLHEIIEKNNSTEIPTEDILNTLTCFTCWSIAENLRLFGNPESQIVVSGGGVENTYLIELLKKELNQSVIIRSDEIGIPADAKEAVCFAYLAYRTLGNLPGNIPSVTGAKRETVLGIIALP